MHAPLVKLCSLTLPVLALALAGCADTGSSSLHQKELAKEQGVDASDCYTSTAPFKKLYAGQSTAQVIVVLDEPGFDFTRLQNATGDDRRALIDERIAQVATSQEAVTQHIHSLDGEVLSSRWLTNQLTVSIPVKNLDALLEHADVQQLCGDIPLSEE